AAYDGTPSFVASPQPSTSTLTIAAASSTTTPRNATAGFNTADETIALHATVTSGAPNGGEGTATFAALNGTKQLGSPATASGNGGAADASFTVPGGTAVGTYSIKAAYDDSATGDYVASFDYGTLTITKPTPTITWSNPPDIVYGTALSSTQL